MADVKFEVSVPEGSAALADGLSKFISALVASHKAAAGNVGVEIAADVTAAVADLIPALAKLGLVGDELKAEPIGVAEAFLLAGLQVARSALGK